MITFPDIHTLETVDFINFIGKHLENDHLKYILQYFNASALKRYIQMELDEAIDRSFGNYKLNS